MSEKTSSLEKNTSTPRIANRRSLISSISARTGVQRSDVELAMDALFDITAETLAGGGEVKISDCVKIYTARRSAKEKKKSFNHLVGREIEIPQKPPRRVVKAKVMWPLRQIVECDIEDEESVPVTGGGK